MGFGNLSLFYQSAETTQMTDNAHEGRRFCGHPWSLVGALIAIAPLATVHAQGNPNQFGGQDRASAVSQMIVLGVQQGISSLPPTSGQSFLYHFDPEAGTFVPEERLGPSIFRSTETVGKGYLNVRVGASYFALAQTFDPVQYLIEYDRPYGAQHAGVVAFGVKAKAKVGVLNFSASYGLLDRVELLFNLPVTIVDAHASQTSSTLVSNSGLPASEATADGVFLASPLSTEPERRALQIAGLSQEFNKRAGPTCALGGDCLTYRRDSFTSLNFRFNDGTHAGVGRMSLGAKMLLYSSDWGRLAFMTELFVPSPSQAEFAGSDTASILPRAVATVPITDWLRFHADLGYDYDFSESDLTRFAWTTGASFPIDRFTFDVGVGGSEYDTAIRWTPAAARGEPDLQNDPPIPGSTLSVLGNNQLGDNFIDVLGGIKVRLWDRLVLEGAVSVPVNDEGFRPAALGTIALEYYFQPVASVEQ